MVVNKGSYGWWEGKGYQVVTKRRKKLVDGKTHRVVELKLVYEPDPARHQLTTQDWRWVEDKGTLLVPVGMFFKHFKVDNTIGLLFEKEIEKSNTEKA